MSWVQIPSPTPKSQKPAVCASLQPLHLNSESEFTCCAGLEGGNSVNVDRRGAWRTGMARLSANGLGGRLVLKCDRLPGQKAHSSLQKIPRRRRALRRRPISRRLPLLSQSIAFRASCVRSPWQQFRGFCHPAFELRIEHRNPPPVGRKRNIATVVVCS